MSAVEFKHSLSKDSVRPQHTFNDCAAAVAAMMLGFHQIEYSYSDLLEDLKSVGDEISLLSLQQLLLNHGLRSTIRLVDKGKISQLPLPSIAFIHGTHFVAIVNVDKSKVTLKDPLAGRIRILRRLFDFCWDGHVLISEEQASVLKIYQEHLC